MSQSQNRSQYLHAKQFPFRSKPAFALNPRTKQRSQHTSLPSSWMVQQHFFRYKVLSKTQRKKKLVAITTKNLLTIQHLLYIWLNLQVLITENFTNMKENRPKKLEHMNPQFCLSRVTIPLMVKSLIITNILHFLRSFAMFRCGLSWCRIMIKKKHVVWISDPFVTLSPCCWIILSFVLCHLHRLCTSPTYEFTQTASVFFKHLLLHEWLWLVCCFRSWWTCDTVADQPLTDLERTAVLAEIVLIQSWWLWTFGWLESQMSGTSIWGGFSPPPPPTFSMKSVSGLQMAFRLRSAVRLSSHKNIVVLETALNRLDSAPDRREWESQRHYHLLKRQ